MYLVDGADVNFLAIGTAHGDLSCQDISGFNDIVSPIKNTGVRFPRAPGVNLEEGKLFRVGIFFGYLGQRDEPQYRESGKKAMIDLVQTVIGSFLGDHHVMDMRFP
jgi:hypothetical protein